MQLPLRYISKLLLKTLITIDKMKKRDIDQQMKIHPSFGCRSRVVNVTCTFLDEHS